MALDLDRDGVIANCPSCGRPNRIRFERLDRKPRCAVCKREMSPVGEPVEARDVASFDALVTRAAVPVLVDFWAPWCGPCHAVAPEVAKAAQAMRGQVVAAKVNTDALPELGGRYSVRSIPTLAVFRKGLLLDRISGAVPAPQIVQLVDRAISGA